MNTISKKLYRWVLLCSSAVALLQSCAKFETREIWIDKPQSIIDQETLDAYKELRNYVDYTGQSHFKLAAELSHTDLVGNSVLYRLAQQHFDQISLTNGLRHVDAVQDDGSIRILDFTSAMKAQASTGLSTHVGHLLWHENQGADYLQSLIADIIIPGESGKDIVIDFENDELGKSYPMIVGGDLSANRVVTDPDGKSGNALNIKGQQTFPQFQVTLPEGRKLGDYLTVTIDFKGEGCCGLYGAGMRLAISANTGNVTFASFGGPSSFGVPGGQWGRGLIELPISSLNLTSAQKEWTEFVLTVGSATGSGDYLIDNITMGWEIVGETIIKTPAEKKEIISGEMEKWIKAIGEAGKETVKSWSVVYQPMDEDTPSELRNGTGINPDDLPTNTFYWQDYLGKDYASIAIGMIKAYASTNDQIFFTETGLLDNPAKIQGLADFIAYTEGKGTTVDGIATELSLNVGDNKEKVENTLQQLAETKKLIKISFDIGTGTTTNQATTALYQQQMDTYKWFIESYFNIIPPTQRAGITFRSPADQPSTSAWRPNQPVGLWTNAGGHQRKPVYVGVVEALQNQ